MSQSDIRSVGMLSLDASVWPPYPQKIAVGSRPISFRRSSMPGMVRAGRSGGSGGCSRASTTSTSWWPAYSGAARWEPFPVRADVLAPGGLHSTIVRCRDPMSHSTRPWSRACAGTRCSHQQRTRAMSSSGSLAIGSAFQAVADVGDVGGPVASGRALPGRPGDQGRGAGDHLHRDPELTAYL